MTDEEVICNFMEPKPSPALVNLMEFCPKWWKWSGGRFECYHPLDLDAIHEVEGRLTDDQWLAYESIFPKLFAEEYPTTDVIRSLLHATTEQKIRALAEVIRTMDPK